MQAYTQNNSTRSENLRLKSKIRQLERTLEDRERENIEATRLLNRHIIEAQQVKRELYELVPDAVIEVNNEGYITYVNNLAGDIYDITQGKIKNGTHITDLIFFMEKPRFTSFVEQVLSGMLNGVSEEYITVTSTGKEIPALINCQLLRRNLKVTGIRILLQDISEQKKVKVEYKRIKEVFDQVCNITLSGIFTVNNKRIITSWNKQAEEITGYKASEVVGRKCFVFDAPRCKEKCGIQHGCSDKEPIFKECFLRSKTGERKTVIKNTAFLRNKKGSIIGAVECFEDITHQKNVINELIEAKQKAEESDNLKSAFLANMSHEIRTPINSILGFVELLRDSSISYAEKSQFLDIIKKSGKQLLSLISDIINISKIEANQVSIKHEDFSLNMLLDELFILTKKDMQNRKKQVKLKLNKEIEANSFGINSDPIRLRQILTNLLTNAIKFTEEGYIEFGYKIKGKSLEFYVKDTGKGIDKRKQKLIFDRFMQAEDNTNTTKGTGLGLAISKGLVELLQGEIQVESKLERGSVFKFKIPYVPAKKNASVESSENYDAMKNYNWKGKTLLLVEDDNINFKYLELMLRKTEINVVRASDGKKAIDTCRERTDIDVILMDIQMPNIDGYEATRAIREFRADIPIIAQTANAMADDQEKCFDAGCNAYLSKPIERELLFSTIEKELKSVTLNHATHNS